MRFDRNYFKENQFSIQMSEANAWTLYFRITSKRYKRSASILESYLFDTDFYLTMVTRKNVSSYIEVIQVDRALKWRSDCVFVPSESIIIRISISLKFCLLKFNERKHFLFPSNAVDPIRRRINKNKIQNE